MENGFRIFVGVVAIIVLIAFLVIWLKVAAKIMRSDNIRLIKLILIVAITLLPPLAVLYSLREYLIKGSKKAISVTATEAATAVEKVGKTAKWLSEK